MRFITDARDRSMLAVVVTRSSEGQCIGLVTLFMTQVSRHSGLLEILREVLRDIGVLN